jgi:CRISPR/Cas system CSM-associated protein Csm3 (group 7 of RAMP superfamily)
MRRIATRIYAYGVWRTESAIHCGSEADAIDSAADMVVVRDREGRPFIPAASIAGAARSYLARRFSKPSAFRASDELPVIHALFGGKYASLLSVCDAECVGEQPAVSIRDGVRIDSRTGIAVDQAKYNFEIIPAGARFQFRFWLNSFDELPEKLPADRLRAAFATMLQGFQGEIRIGAKTRKGLGRGKVEPWTIREFETSNAEHYQAWLDRGFDAGREIRIEDLLSEPFADKRRCFKIEARLRLKTSLLIRAAGENVDAPDNVHLTENGNAVVPGTSFAGVLRHRVERIANTMLVEPGAAQAAIETLLGPLKREGWTPRAGRVTVEESIIPASTFDLLVQGRVAIDRFTGGALEQHLFDEAVVYPRAGSDPVLAASILFELPDEINRATRQQMALLLHAFRDLWTGDLSIGGEVGCGRGVWQGISAEFSAPELDTLRINSSGGDAPAISTNLDGARLDTWRQIGRALTTV